MAKKVSKNSRIAQRAGNQTSKEYVKVVKSVKDPVTGKYSYKEQMIHKDKVAEFFGK